MTGSGGVPLRWRRLLQPAVALCLAGVASGQQGPLTLVETVREAAEHYPSVRASFERNASAAEAVSLARAAWLPRMDLLAQANRATRNNVFGMLLPQSAIAPISGPVLGTAGAASVWGSAVGVLTTWEPFDFGLRTASEGVSRSGQRRSQAALERTRFEVSVLAADAFLTVLAAEQAEKAAAAGVNRAQALLGVIETLARAQLRPEADVSQGQAELAMAEASRIQASQAVREARISLAQYTGREPAMLAPGPLLDSSAEPSSSLSAGEAHPVLAEQTAAVAEAGARRRVLDRSWYPRFLLQGTSYARGSGARTDGSTLEGVSGLAPDVPNWAVGMTVTFPLFELSSIRAKQRIEAHLERAEQEKQRQFSRELNARLRSALAALDGARELATKVPIQLAAARKILEQVTARYRAGLAGIVDVAGAQRLVVQSEIDESLSRLNVWRAHLAVASARGDLDPFLKAAAR